MHGMKQFAFLTASATMLAMFTPAALATATGGAPSGTSSSTAGASMSGGAGTTPTTTSGPAGNFKGAGTAATSTTTGTTGATTATASATGRPGVSNPATVDGSASVTSNIDWTAEDRFWRDNYSNRPYFSENRNYDVYQPAYRYGVDTFNRERGRRFDDLNDSDLRAGWDSVRGTSTLTWDQARQASRDAYERLSSRPSMTGTAGTNATGNIGTSSPRTSTSTSGATGGTSATMGSSPSR